jgi:hypothetical protein
MDMSMRLPGAQPSASGQGVGVIPRSAAASRNGALGGLTTPNKSNGIVTSQTFREWTPLARDVTGLVVTFSNWSMTVSGEVAGDNAITVKAAVEYNGAYYPLLFGGQRTVTIQPGDNVASDPLTIAIPAAASVWIRTYVTVNGVASGRFPWGRAGDSLIANRDSSSSNGVDVADGTGTTSLSSAAHFAYGPTKVCGLDVVANAVGLLGDSIAAGTGTTYDILAVGNSMLGFLERAVGTLLPWISATRSSYRYSFLTPGCKALAVFGNGAVHDVIDAIGRNDIASSDSLATVQANAIATWNALKALGVTRVFKTTITPIGTTSTDNFITVANQTVIDAAAEVVRVAFNAWLRAGAPILAGAAVADGTPGAIIAGQAGHPLYAIIETSDTVESSRDSGKWAIAATSRTITGLSVGAGSRTIGSATAGFTTADIGATIQIFGAGPAGATLNTKITRINSAISAVVLTPATTALAGSGTASLGGVVDDGIHPSDLGATLMGVPVKAALGI